MLRNGGAAAGEDFASEPSNKDIAGTRRNMLSPALLDSETHPRIDLAIADIQPGDAANAYVVTLQATVKGGAYRFEAPATVTESADQLTIVGEFSLLQTGLGLTPFSVMLGALQVEDEMHVRYSIVARAGDDS